MKVSLDGGATWVEVENVRVSQAVEDPEGENEGHIEFNFTGEGLVTDVWVNDVCEGTSSEMYQEIGDRLVQ